jgi:dienelactone hydrolase
MNAAFPKAFFDKLGLVSLLSQYYRSSSLTGSIPACFMNRRGMEPYVRWYGRTGVVRSPPTRYAKRCKPADSAERSRLRLACPLRDVKRGRRWAAPRSSAPESRDLKPDSIAHIRGGSELGRRWYEQGRLMHKRNTFTDFIACAEHLVKEGYTGPERLAIMGGSAGGLLMGAVTNMRPDLFKAMVALVPFAKVITAMLTPQLPLTISEYEQWGRPDDPEAFRYMLSYSPYENVEAKAYPHLFVKGGLNDLQVPYWDPAKWVAKLRAHKTDDNRLLLVTNMAAGHGGASGRYDHLREDAQVYAFLIDALGAPAEPVNPGDARSP